MIDEIKFRDEYFNWMHDMVCLGRYDGYITYRRLLDRLHNIPFTYIMRMDANRYDDGIDLRYRFCQDNGYKDLTRYLAGPCSVLEMMVALAMRCEDFMDNTAYGDRTSQWFWSMIVSLGLGAMSDDRYDRHIVDEIIDIFLNREYAPDGRGGLFTIKNCEDDMRDLEIWHQMCRYSNNFA